LNPIITKKFFHAHVNNFYLTAALVASLGTATGIGADDPALPASARPVWELKEAWRQASPTRERVSLNGLWRWQPEHQATNSVPSGNWGYFKVPGSWPGITDYMQKDCQTVFRHPAWKDEPLGALAMAWYQREIEIPAGWTGRRISLATEYLNSFASVQIDGKRIGEMRFPSGEVDLTAVCNPGGHYTLSVLVVAMPLKGVMLSYTDSASAREVKGEVQRRGFCGDVYLDSCPLGERIERAEVQTSVRKGEVAIRAFLAQTGEGRSYSLEAQILDNGRKVAKFRSPVFGQADIRDGRFTFTQPWRPNKLWDISTPTNQFEMVLSLLDAKGKVLDVTHPSRFGFRELWIEGKDFHLNGSRIFLRAVPLDNAQVSASLATYEGTRETLERLKAFGINFVYTHNYDCLPGSHLSFEEILRAADDVGMLVALTQPHFSHYDWKTPGADQTNGYAMHADFYARVAGNHPSVVFYSMSHNATGYNEDMNPDLIDGVHDPRDQWASNNAKLALRAEAIVNRLDPGRIVYHHASGNLGAIHSMNFYPNFVPVQELSDWFEHWANEGVKPAFTCEYGAPFTWDWTMYRGWYRGEREFGSARVPWEFCVAEWNAQFFGDAAYQISEAEKANLRWEAKQFQAGNLWHRWDYPVEVGSSRLEERYPVFASYLTDNWRAFRTWGLSGTSPWEYEHFWKLRDGVDRSPKQLKVDWDHLQRPGFSPDFVDQQFERMDLAFERSDWIPTVAAQALIRNNGPLLAYIGGKPAAFTSKDHNFYAGETVEKQIVVINDSRQAVTAHTEWSLDAVPAASSSGTLKIATGDQARTPIKIKLPASLGPGTYQLKAAVRFNGGLVQTDTFDIHVLARPITPRLSSRIGLFDPVGETEKWLRGAGIAFKSVDEKADLAAFDVLIVGKAALTTNGPAPDISRVRDGLRVLLFEQTPEVLERRFGFRVAQYGLRTAFKRVPNHPLLAGLNPECLRDWRGEATILPPRLTYTMRPRAGTTVQWCDIPVTRLWRRGNRGNVASVLIEKPARGDFFPIIDGGFDLQFSPLMEFREGAGMILFCQMDITGRTEPDPAVDTLGCNLLRYLSEWKPATRRTVVYAGDATMRSFLDSEGIAVTPYAGAKLLPDQLLVAGPGAGAQLSGKAPEITEWLASGGRLLALGLAQQDVEALLPNKVKMRTAEHISCYFPAPDSASFAAGVGPSDVHVRAPRQLPLVSSGATVLGDGALAQVEGVNVFLCQLAPWQFADPNADNDKKQLNLKRTRRRMSFLVDRLLANLGASGSTPILSRFSTPTSSASSEKRWLDGLYLDQPEEWDDPYRFFRW